MNDNIRIVAAILAAGILIAGAIYIRPATGRYSFQGNVRFDTLSGTIAVCRRSEGCIDL